MKMAGDPSCDVKSEMKKQVSIHVREDSETDLERLFASAMNKGGSNPMSLPLRMRNLPASFWQPPSIGSKSPSVHSREGSLDNSSAPFSPGGGPQAQGSPQTQPPVGQHSRANSCPATLGQTLAAAQQHQNQANQHLHLRQQSYDVGGGDTPLPPGWEMAKTADGQIYFMNHIMKTTQWDDPRRQIQMQMISQQMNPTGSPVRAGASPVPGAQGQAASDQQQLPPLEDGWEESYTAQGELYFIHHPTKRTTWYDPRLSIAQQQTAGPHAHQPRQLQARLQRLAAEKSRLHKRNELLLMSQRRQQQQQENQSQQQQNMSQAQEMMMRHSLSEFPGQGPAQQTEVHNRQESTDSGLGSTCNLGIIQEDMVMENMDTQDLDTTLTAESQGGAGGGAGQGAPNMDTEELMPALQGLGAEYIQTILNPDKEAWL